MKIVVCVKQVPDTNEIKIDQKTGTLIRDGVPSIINPDDMNALEEALRLKDENGAEVTVITMGPPQAKEALKEALAMGADRAILVSDRAFAGADTWATTTTLVGAIKKLGSFDIIFCGRQAIDGDTAQVGPQIAERLEIPQITYVQKVNIDGNKITVERAIENGHYTMETVTPVLLTAIKELNVPRYPSIKNIIDIYDGSEKVDVWTLSDLDVDQDQIGLSGSPTQVFRSFTPEPKAQGEMLSGEISEMNATLIAKLTERSLL